MSFFKKLKDGLFKTSSKISEGVKNVFVRKKIDAETLEDLEEVLITADLGVSVVARILDKIKAQKYDRDIEIEAIQKLIAEEITSILSPLTKPLSLDHVHTSPKVILVAGVNGSGKTTTIAKLAKQFVDEKLNVHLIAADTFRAAAVGQLQTWADRVGVSLHKGNENADPASVVFEGYAKGKNADIIMVDTAGRLHNKSHLMEELNKIVRVLKKQDEALPHETILVLDATTGQNALQQVEVFSKTIPLTGLIVTKLDGTAKGGIVVAIAEKYKLPIYAIGVGESFDDLQPFNAHDFAHSLVGLDDATS